MAQQEIEDVVTPELEAELVQKHGRPLRALKTVAGVVVIRLVKRDAYKRFREMALNAKTQAGASEYLAQAACCYPDNKTVREWLDRFPGIAIRMANVAAQLVGQEMDDDEGKELGG